MTDIAALGLRVDGVGNIEAASSSLDRFTKSGSSAERSADNLATTASNTTSQLKRLAVAAAAGFSVRQIQQYADTWSDLTSLVKVNIGSQENAADVMRRLSDIARQTYSSLEQTAQGFAQNAFTLNALGKSTQDQLNYTEALNNALVVSGAKGERAQMVQNSLNRAMAEGSLRGQELQNILNSGSRVAELLAKELGVNVTELRSMAAQGKITSDVIYSSLVTNMKELSDQAASMPATVADSFTLLRNSVLQMVGVYDQANGVSEDLANTLVSLADTIQGIDLSNVVDGLELLAIVVGVRMVASYGAMAKTGLTAAGASLAATTSFNAQTLALTRTTVASNAAALAMRGASAAMALVGGPIGIAAIAALSAYSIASNRAAAEDRERERIMSSLQKMSAEANSESGLEKRIARESASIKQLTVEIDDAKSKIQELALLSSQNAAVSASVNQSIASLWGGIESKTAKIKEYENSIASLNSKLGEISGGSKGGSGGVSANMQKAIDDMAEGYRRQIALTKDATETEKLLYEAQNGRLKGIPTAQLAVLEGLTKEIDLRNQLAEREKAGKDYERTMSGLGGEMGASEEINRLNDFYAQRADIIARAFETQYIDQQAHDQAMIELDAVTTAERMRILDDYNRAQQAAALNTMGNIVSITKTQIDQMAALSQEGSTVGKTFFIMSQTLAAANAIIYGLQSSMAIKAAYDAMSATAGLGAPAIQAAGAVHAATASALGFATAGMIMGQTIAGFRQGGYTGNAGVGDVAGVVHGREYVFDAASTARIGRGNLDRMRAGGDIGGGSAAPVINVINNGESKSASATMRQDQDKRWVIDVMLDDIASGGRYSRATQSTFGLGRVGQ